jgi:hypothetical protein
MTIREQVLAAMRKKWNKAWAPSEVAMAARLPRHKTRQALRDMATDGSGLVEIAVRGKLGTGARETTYRYLPKKELAKK